MPTASRSTTARAKSTARGQPNVGTIDGHGRPAEGLRVDGGLFSLVLFPMDHNPVRAATGGTETQHSEWNGSFKSKRTCSTCSRPAGSKGRFISHRGLTSRFLSEVPARQIKATHKGARLRLTEKPRLQPRECVTKPGNISQGSGAGLWRIQTLCRTRRSSGRCR